MCPECVEEEETAEHVFFVCPRFVRARSNMMAVSGPGTTPDNLVRRMCDDPDIWNAVCAAASQIVLELQRVWRVNHQHASGS